MHDSKGRLSTSPNLRLRSSITKLKSQTFHQFRLEPTDNAVVRVLGAIKPPYAFLLKARGFFFGMFGVCVNGFFSLLRIVSRRVS